MCRHNQLWGCVLIAFGVGIFVGAWLESGLLRGCFAFGLAIIGFCIARR